MIRFLRALILTTSAALAEPIRIKDLVEFDGVRGNDLVGYGLVVGLNGTGDGLRNAPFTEEIMANLLERLGANVTGEEFRPKNVAAVFVTAQLPPFARSGGRIDVTVSAIGDAKSLLGGTLVMTPLNGADGQIYAVAQGTIIAGGDEIKRFKLRLDCFQPGARLIGIDRTDVRAQDAQRGFLAGIAGARGFDPGLDGADPRLQGGPRILGRHQLLPRLLRQTPAFGRITGQDAPVDQGRHRKAGKRVAQRRVRGGGRKLRSLARRDGGWRKRAATLVEGAEPQRVGEPAGDCRRHLPRRGRPDGSGLERGQHILDRPERDRIGGRAREDRPTRGLRVQKTDRRGEPTRGICAKGFDLGGGGGGLGAQQGGRNPRGKIGYPGNRALLCSGLEPRVGGVRAVG